jgi:TolB-like protein/Tfp pilus assembly protein PilF
LTPGGRPGAAGWLDRESIESVAVLPFENATGDPANGYVGDGLTESLTSALSRLSNLKVASRASVVRYRATGDLDQIGRALGVEAVLLGRVSQRGDRLSISVELVNCGDGRQLWGEQYSPRAADIFVVQADIARDALRALGRSLTQAEEVALRARDPRNLDAYRHYLRGRQRMDKRDRDGFSHAIADFREAVARDPDYAVAHVGLADAYALMGYYRLNPPKESYQHARIEVLRALQIDGALAEAHASLAWLLTHYGWDWMAAEGEYRRAIELDPRYAPARHGYSNHLSLMGRHDEAIAQATRAVELEPLSLSINSSALGNAYLQAGRYDEAIEQLRKALELDRSFGNARVGLGPGVLAQRATC